MSKLLTTLVLVAALLSLFGETVSDAQQVRVNDRIVTSSSLPAGIVRDGPAFTFKTGGSQAPTILGILTPPQTEPTLPAQHGAMWVYCSGPTEATVCALKVNVFGTPFELARAVWSLQ